MNKFTITRKDKKNLKREFRRGMGIKSGIDVMRRHSDPKHAAVRAAKNALQ